MTDFNPFSYENTVSEMNHQGKIIRQTRIVLLTIMILSIVLDQISKQWVSTNLIFLRPVNVFGNYLRMLLAHNYGLIWGLPIKSNLSYYILPIVGIVFVSYMGLKTKLKISAIAYGLIIGGAFGNLIDRIRLGYVVDFIDMGINNTRWPTYNLADLAIVVGIILIIAREIFKPSNNPTEYNSA